MDRTHLGDLLAPSTRRTRPGPRRNPRRLSLTRDERALTESIGTTLLIGIMFVTTAGLGAIIMAQAPAEQTHATFELQLDPGQDGWGSGDEQIIIQHRGGQAVALHDVRFEVRINDGPMVYQGDDLDYPGGPFDDGAFRIGEQWTTRTTIFIDDVVTLSVVVHGQDQRTSETRGYHQNVLFDGAMVATALDCTFDFSPPSIVEWTQIPGVLSSATTGPLLVRVRYGDDCAGVDLTTPPSLEHRIPGGTVPDWKQASPMGLVSGGTATWQTTIPEPPGEWANHSGLVLEYRTATQPNDLLGNTAPGPSAARHVEILDAFQPTAHFTAACIDLDCSFDATSSAPHPDRTLVSYTWTLGDGTNRQTAGPHLDHAYATPGTYLVGLTVTDDQGSAGAFSRNVVTSEDLHAHDLVYKRTGAGQKGVFLWVATSTEAPVQGASVIVTMCRAGDPCIERTATTDANGRAMLESRSPNRGTWTTCVDEITHPDYAYDPAQDHIDDLFIDPNGKTCRTEVV